MPKRHVLLAVLVTVVWGVNFVVIHVGLDTFPPLLLAALRFTFTALPAVFLVERPDVPWRFVVGLGLTSSAGQFGFLFVSMDQGMPAGLASLVLQLQAVFTVLLAVALLHERPRTGQLVGAGIAFGGIAIIGAGRAEGVPLAAFALTIAAAACWGVGNVVTRHAKTERPLSLFVWSSLVPPLPLAALSAAIEDPAAAQLDAPGALSLAYLVLVSGLFGWGAWTFLLKTHPASTVAPFTLLVPVTGITTAWIALGEQPTAGEALGAVIVLTGLASVTAHAVPRRRGHDGGRTDRAVHRADPPRGRGHQPHRQADDEERPAQAALGRRAGTPRHAAPGDA